jgi:hypothetical protein
MKLPALKGSASRNGIFLYIAPLEPALRGGACGTPDGQQAYPNFQFKLSPTPKESDVLIWRYPFD